MKLTSLYVIAVFLGTHFDQDQYIEKEIGNYQRLRGFDRIDILNQHFQKIFDLRNYTFTT